MFNIRTPKDQPSHELDATITNLITEVNVESDAETELALANAVKVLMEARTADKASSKKPSVSPDTIVSVAASILSIGLIMHYEKMNVITTKAFTLIPKIKI